MTADLKPYPEYKDSGLPWLGEIPKHWEMMKMKYLFRERSEKGYPDEPLLAATQTMGVVRKEHYENRTVLALKDLHLLKLVRIGDFVISLRSFQGGIEYAHYQGIISPAYTVLCPSHQVNPKYFTALLKSKPYIDNLSIFVTGIRQGQNIDYERLSRSFLPVPMFEELETIGAFISYTNHRINRLIHDKQRLIELLNEQKKAIIHRAVTHGLNPNIRLKPSGIDWLGDLPEHWEVKRLKSIGHIRYGLGQPPRESSSGLPLIRATNVERGRIVEKGMIFVAPEDVPPARDAFLRAGEIIVVRSGAYTADSAIVPIEYNGAVAGYDMVLSVRLANSEFIALALLSKYVLDQLYLLRSRAAQPHLNAEELGITSIFLPPRNEQMQIVSEIHALTADLSVPIDRTHHEIKLLHEYRTRLIADVVTGKLDVRGVELPVMDEAKELEDIGTGEDTEAEEFIESEEVADADE